VQHGHIPADARGSPRAGIARLRSVLLVRLPFVPGPSEVLAAVDGVREGVTDALDLVPRLGRVVGRVEELLDCVGGLVDRVEAVVDRAETALDGLDATQQRADAAVRRAAGTIDGAESAIAAVSHTQQRADAAIAAVASTQERADAAITAVGRTTGRADDVLGRAEGLVGRVEPMIGDYSESLALLAPAVRRLAETLDPDEVEAMVRLIDQLPSIATHLDEVVLPVLGSLDNVGDDVHDLLETMQDLRQLVKGLPGSRLFRRRGAEEIALDDAEEAAGS
jgi:ABC-type transporter Mla subunit MlaD